MTTTSTTPPASDELADQVAPLDALLVDPALGPARQVRPEASTARFATPLTCRPRTTGHRLGSLTAILLDFHVMRHMADIEAIHTYEGKTIQTLIVGKDITGVGAFT